MRLIVDAHLPRTLVRWLRSIEIDAVHTLDLPAGNRTEDGVIIDLADREGRWVVTKDGFCSIVSAARKANATAVTIDREL